MFSEVGILEQIIFSDQFLITDFLRNSMALNTKKNIFILFGRNILNKNRIFCFSGIFGIF